MRVKRVRQIYFVCSAVIGGELKNKLISAMSSKEAASLFFEELGEQPQDIFGPFYKKREKNVIQNNTVIKFSGSAKKAEYNGWVVNAFILSDPQDHAYLIFLNKTSGTSMEKPGGSTIVPINSLRFYDV